MKAKTIIILLLAAILLVAAACGPAGGANEQQPQEQPQEQPLEAVAVSNPGGGEDIGEGSTVFLFEVTDDEGDITSWNVHTDAETVGLALVELGLIEGIELDFGLMVLYVNGLRADYDEDGAWWAFYIDDEMAMAGVDATEIEEGVTYAFVYTEA